MVGTVKEAIAALERQHFDLLFLDLKLPDGPADEVYDAAKQIDPDLAIVIITGYPDSAMLNRILMRGPVTVLKKPLKIEQLKQTVRILGHKEATRSRPDPPLDGNGFALDSRRAFRLLCFPGFSARLAQR